MVGVCGTGAPVDRRGGLDAEGPVGPGGRRGCALYAAIGHDRLIGAPVTRPLSACDH